MRYELKKISMEDGRDIYDMLQEMPRDENGFINSMKGKSYEEFREWIRVNYEFSKETELVDGWKVPSMIYWFYADDRPVGFGKLRYFLTDKLLEEGGNAGYGIRPSNRGEGHGSELLKGIVKDAGEMNIEKILLTIRKENQASIKVGLKNGGIIEKEKENRVYIWINTDSPE